MAVRSWLPATLALTLLAGCPDRSARRGDVVGGGGGKVLPPRARPVTQTTLAAVGLDAAAIDDRVSPCDDFQRFACGARDPARPPPGAEVEERNDAALRGLLEAADAPAGAAAFYRACMDEAAVEKDGALAIDFLAREARRVRDRRSAVAMVARLHEHGVWPLFALRAGADRADSTRTILYIEEDGLGMGGPEPYLATGGAAQAARTAYRTRVVGMLRALGGRSTVAARRAADDILRVETALARAWRPQGEIADAAAAYDKVDRAGLERIAPRFGWAEYLRLIGRPELRDVSVDAPRYLTAVDRLLGSERAAAWAAYLEWTLARTMAPALAKRFAGEDATPRWRRCVAATRAARGGEVGRAFAAAHLPDDARAGAAAMLRELSLALTIVLHEAAWLTPETRQRALEKLAGLDRAVGGPVRPAEDGGAVGAVHAANVLSAKRAAVQRALARVGEARDRAQWEVSPVASAAWLDASANRLEVPAGMLQAPLFAAGGLLAVSYGGAGARAARALLRAFDEGGARFDLDGNLARWWTDAEAADFRARGDCVAERAGATGAVERADAIADQGGTLLAFRAYRSARAVVRARTMADRFDEDQLFFLAAAQARCGEPAVRVNATLGALPEFHRAWSCELGGAMRPPATCRVW
ncbi:MAG TPA: M13 family metallopeptidase [Kofleriaceae bacterium]|nr:M13 family metallopeptidase [Kofleriaceae bacterium]